MVVLMPSTIARGGRPRSGAVGTTESASEESPSEEPSVDCRRVPDDEDCRRTAQPDHSFGDLSGAERRLDPLEPEPAEPHLEGSERSARAESGMSGCSGCDRGVHHGTHGQGSWQIVTLEELRGEFERSNSLINAADLAPSSKTTYLVHADRFVRMACRGS
jgi:hypothetical protein